jgi:hypothetical protein
MEQVDILAQQFTEAGWSRSCPALVGYRWDGSIQLLSGSHRWEAAKRAGIKVPVVLVPFERIERAWGIDLAEWSAIMRSGDNCVQS